MKMTNMSKIINMVLMGMNNRDIIFLNENDNYAKNNQSRRFLWILKEISI